MARNRTPIKTCVTPVTAENFDPKKPWFYMAKLLGRRPRIRLTSRAGGWTIGGKIDATFRGRDANLYDVGREVSIWPIGRITAGSCLAVRCNSVGDRVISVVSMRNVDANGEVSYDEPPENVMGRSFPISPLQWAKAAPRFSHVWAANEGNGFDQ